MRKKTLTILCPVYNEEAVIEAFYRELGTTVNTLTQYETSILFVVDRSKDRTLEILKNIAGKDKRVRVLSLSTRFGHQMSLLAGMDHTNTDLTLMMDSDLQHPPSLIPTLLAKYEEGFDIVSTRRLDDQSKNSFRKFLSVAFYKILSKLSPVPIELNSADFRLITKKVLRVFQEQIRERNLFLRGLFAWVGFSRTSVDFVAPPRFAGNTKYSLSRLIRFASAGVLCFSKLPLNVATMTGFFLGLMAFGVGVVTFFQWLTLDHLPSGWTTIVLMVTFYSAMQFLFLGILGEYIGAIFDEVKHRPHYLVDEYIGEATLPNVAFLQEAPSRLNQRPELQPLSP